jgi:hypothetical protein
MEHDGHIVLKHKVKVAHGDVSGSDSLDMNDLTFSIGLEGPGWSAQFAEKDPSNVFCVHDSRGAFDQFPAINDAKPYCAGVWNFVNA